MMPNDPVVEPVPELEAFLRPIGTRRRTPADVRKSALAHARAIAAAGAAIPRSPRPTALLGRVPRLALACSVLAIGGIAAFAALRGRAVRDEQPGPRAGSQPTEAIHLEQAPEAREPPVHEPPVDEPTGPMQAPAKASDGRAAPADVGRNVLAVEIDLLRRARAAFNRREFSRALMLVAEHARRFPQGHLAEEREALRVHSLQRAGRAAEADRAAEAFAIQYPRSVLLTPLTEESDARK